MGEALLPRPRGTLELLWKGDFLESNLWSLEIRGFILLQSGLELLLILQVFGGFKRRFVGGRRCLIVVADQTRVYLFDLSSEFVVSQGDPNADLHSFPEEDFCLPELDAVILLLFDSLEFLVVGRHARLCGRDACPLGLPIGLRLD